MPRRDYSRRLRVRALSSAAPAVRSRREAVVTAFRQKALSRILAAQRKSFAPRNVSASLKKARHTRKFHGLKKAGPNTRSAGSRKRSASFALQRTRKRFLVKRVRSILLLKARNKSKKSAQKLQRALVFYSQRIRLRARPLSKPEATKKVLKVHYRRYLTVLGKLPVPYARKQLAQQYKTQHFITSKRVSVRLHQQARAICQKFSKKIRAG